VLSGLSFLRQLAKNDGTACCGTKIINVIRLELKDKIWLLLAGINEKQIPSWEGQGVGVL